MVDQSMLTYIHARLQQIKRSSYKEPFGNVSILAVGDFHQIQPVKGRPLFKQDLGSFLDLWGLFSIWTLSTIMRQKDDLLFAQLLNRLRTHGKGQSIKPDDATLLQSCIVSEISNDAPFIAAKREDVDRHNDNMLQSIDSHIEVIRAVDIYRTKSGILKKLKNPSPTAKTLLPLEIKVAQDACVMLTENIDVSDGLVNGVIGKVTSIFHGSMPNGQPEAICILFDDSRVRREWRKKNPPPHNVNNSSIVIHTRKEIYSIRLHHITRYQYPHGGSQFIKYKG
ncbi:ATP-dependent DNA helicase PIF1 [Holothuria leucospilota]|uniref:ATP-dependent DNA helicase PIF1 n=1 Tax=Holothuria leucospilota TaxID=206669 RepID=A0A9Q0YPR3_HOLLE|nr:ATP-dependent DNA helicase PIF1 [Holothuria leucospilota]